MCYNKYFTAQDLLVGETEDNCYFITFRYDICEFVRQYARKLWENPTPITSGEYFNKIYYHTNAYFIDNWWKKNPEDDPPDNYIIASAFQDNTRIPILDLAVSAFPWDS